MSKRSNGSAVKARNGIGNSVATGVYSYTCRERSYDGQLIPNKPSTGKQTGEGRAPASANTGTHHFFPSVGSTTGPSPLGGMRLKETDHGKEGGRDHEAVEAKQSTSESKIAQKAQEANAKRAPPEHKNAICCDLHGLARPTAALAAVKGVERARDTGNSRQTMPRPRALLLFSPGDRPNSGPDSTWAQKVPGTNTRH
ncbi:hypothetical protein ANO11243_068320 [Dothideomycetidae sp. 11243]|nr:hypothetical protein ANO11243_068320 [fungal sp. No.11243]